MLGKLLPARKSRSQQLAADLEARGQEKAAAEAELSQLRVARPDMLLDMGDSADAALDAHDAKIRKAERAIERAVALQAKLLNEIAAAEAEEEQARRTEVFEAARIARDDAAKAIRKEYLAAASKIVALLTKVEDARQLVAAANQQLPQGCDPIPDPETFRSRRPDRGPPNEETYFVFFDEAGKEVPSNQCYADRDPLHGVPASTFHTTIWPDNEPGSQGVLVKKEGVRVPVTRKQKNRITYPHATSFDLAIPLDRQVRLPGLDYGSPDLWNRTPNPWNR